MNKLRKLLEEKGISPYRLGRMAGVDHAAIYKLIQGKQKDILLSTAFKLADALAVDINEFREEDKHE